MDIQLGGLLVGVVLPLLVGLVTTRATDPAVKAVLLALLSAATGLVSEWIATPHGFDWRVAGLTALGAFLTAVGSHFGLLKPVGVSQYVQANVGRHER